MDFSKLFIKADGKPIIHNGKNIIGADKIELKNKNIKIKVTFISTNSKLKQGIMLDTNGKFIFKGCDQPPRIVIWEDNEQMELIIDIVSKDKILWVYNGWQWDDGTEGKWDNGSAMYIEEITNGKIYYCNDFYPDDDFDDLIFKIEFL